MPASKEITNMIKEMEQNLKQHLKTSIDEAMEKVYHKLDRQEKTMDEIIKSQKFLSSEFENLKITVEEIKQQDFLNKINHLNEKIIHLEKQISEQDTLRDELDQYNRRENLEFHGIPEQINENTNFIIKEMAKKINVQIKDSDISTSHRLPASKNKHPPIIVRFTNRDIKNKIYYKRRNLIGVNDFGITGMTKLFINENLTPKRKKLFSLAYKKRIELNYQYIWSNNGEIYLRKNSTSDRIKISSLEDIHNLP